MPINMGGHIDVMFRSTEATEKFFNDAEKEESSLLDEIRRRKKIDQARESELRPQYDKLSQLRHKMNIVNEYAKLGKNAK